MKYLLSVILVLLQQFSCAQVTSDSSWAFINGDGRRPVIGEYGTIGIASSLNLIGGRKGAVSWKDNAGNCWIYGGDGIGFDCAGWMSDLWKYDINTNEWTWISGSKKCQVLPVYGIKGIAGASNTPGSRVDAASWTDTSGNLWLFGGLAYDYPNSYYNVKNDLWKYNISSGMWTWINGDTVINQSGFYGTRGVPNSLNKPGGRVAAATWSDSNGNLWMYGGAAATSSDGAAVPMSDLWKYDPAVNFWTWMKGDTTALVPGVYGSPGVANANNNPGQRMYAMCWKDKNGKFWLFGGRISNDNFPEFYNDLWRYDPVTNNWTWMKGPSSTNQNPVFGTRGIASAASMPGARYSGANWTDTSGNLWLLGGRGYSYTYGLNNDLWKYNIGTNQWTWMNGSQYADQNGIYGLANIYSTANMPGSRFKMVSFSDAGGNLFLSGGEVYTAAGDRLFNDLWKFDVLLNQWAWIKGDKKTTLTGSYNIKAVPSTRNKPGSKQGAVSWKDKTGNLWLFGGYGNDGIVNIGYTNDLWKYDVTARQWVWMKGGTTLDNYGSYGTKGVVSPGNNPGSREGAAGWTDTSGNLWLYGGNGYSINNTYGYLSDLWKYNIAANEWVWVKGDSDFNRKAVYGTPGIGLPENKPGGRKNAHTWIDSNGDLWLFGGYGYESGSFPNTGEGYCSDLWKYNIAANEWTWIKGASVINAYTNYGIIGRDSVTNTPGGRDQAAVWTDNNGKFWLYGGFGYNSSTYGLLNDLWKFDPVDSGWTFMQGTKLRNGLPFFGAQNIFNAANTPGGLEGAVTFKDKQGDFWLFGGNNAVDIINTLWKLDAQTLQWAWIKGDTLVKQYGVYGKQGVSNAVYKPGARSNAVSWVDNKNNFWMYGGFGTASNSNGADACTLYNQQISAASSLNDLWTIGISIPDTITALFCANTTLTFVSDVQGVNYQWKLNSGAGFINVTDNSNFTGASAASLQAANIPSSWNNYLFQCFIDGTKVSRVIKLKLLYADAGADKAICSGPAVIGAASVEGNTYSWSSDPAGFVASTSNPTVNPVVTTTYYLTVHNNACTITGTVILKKENSWTGSVNTEWENAGNWSCGILPDSTTSVIIKSGLVNYPIVRSNPVVAGLSVKPGASVLVNTGYSLTMAKH